MLTFMMTLMMLRNRKRRQGGGQPAIFIEGGLLSCHHCNSGTMVIKAAIMMTVQRHPRPGVDQSGHSDIHHEGAAHPPQDVEAHQPSDRHHRDYDHDAEYRLQLISTFPSVRLLHITRDEPRRIRVLTHYGSGGYLLLHRFCDCLISEIGQLVVISNMVTTILSMQEQAPLLSIHLLSPPREIFPSLSTFFTQLWRKNRARSPITLGLCRWS